MGQALLGLDAQGDIPGNTDDLHHRPRVGFADGAAGDLEPAVAAPGMAQPYAALLLEQRRGQATFIPSSPFAPTADPGEAALRTYLTQNAAKFTVPERRVIQYALFDRSAVPVPAVTDAEIAKVYKDSAAQFAASETRRFAQVILPDQAAANALAAKVRGGTSLDQPGKRGAVNLMAATLEEGAGDLDAQGFAAARDGLAAQIGFGANSDEVSVSVQALSENRAAAMDLLRLALSEPRFDETALDRVKGQVLAGLRAVAR